MWLSMVLVLILLVLLVLGALMLLALAVCLFQGAKEMGRCNNGDRLGVDLTFTELHGDRPRRSRP